MGTSLADLRFRHRASTAGGEGSISGWGTTIPTCSTAKKKKKVIMHLMRIKRRMTERVGWECTAFGIEGKGENGQVALVVENPPANAEDMEDSGSIPGLRRSPGGGHGNPLQYSCLENPTDR